MKITSDYKNFEKRAEKNENQLVVARTSSDLYTPILLAMQFDDEDYCGLFESVEGGKNRARYSFIVMKPDLIFKCEDNKALICNNVGKGEFVEQKEEVFSCLRGLVNSSKIDIPSDLPSMSAGIFGYMGYDMVRLMEKLPDNNEDVIGISDSIFIRPKIVIIFDSVKDELIIVASIFNYDNGIKETYDNTVKLIEDTYEKIKNPTFGSSVKCELEDIEFSSNITRNDYHLMVRKAKEYILAGDIFQVVPSQRFTADFQAPAISFYRSLRRLNPSPYSFYLKLKDFSLVGSSPEILVRLKDDIMTVRPIAGTRKRGENKIEDQELAADLLSDQKELAEHLMLIDLGRNDVGRICQVGSVKLTEKEVIEYYSHVMHIVSNVEGKKHKKFDAIDALIAGFPVGTVTGAPKIRAMEIIDELEKHKRSFYAGGVGYISSNGDMDTCISLRTALIKDRKIYIQAGGGVVADSDEESEYQESCNKAKALMQAAKLTN